MISKVYHFYKSLPFGSMLDSDARVLFSRNDYLVIVPPSKMTTCALYAINMELAYQRHDLMLMIQKLCEDEDKLSRSKGTPSIFQYASRIAAMSHILRGQLQLVKRPSEGHDVNLL